MGVGLKPQAHPRVHGEVVSMNGSEATKYSVYTFDSDGQVYRADDLLDEDDALAYLAASDVLHAMGHWRVEKCACGLGRVYVHKTSGRERGVHLQVEDDDEVLSIALALGLLAPGSLDGRLAEVGI